MMAENKGNGAKTSDLTAYRKKRKQKQFYKKLAVASAVLIVIVIIAANFSSIIEPLRGIASRIDIGPTRCSDAPVTAQVLAILPVF